MFQTKSFHRRTSNGQTLSSVLLQVLSKNGQSRKLNSSSKSFNNLFTNTLKKSTQKRYSSNESDVLALGGNPYEDPWSTYPRPTYKGSKFPESSFAPYLPSEPVSEFGVLEAKSKINLSESTAIGKCVVLENAEIAKYFPEGLLGEFKKKDFDLIHQGQKTGFIIRQEAVKVNSQLKDKFWLNTKKKQILLHGVNGCGKSGVLSSIIYYARNQGFIVLVVNGWDITHNSFITKSVKNPGYFDSNDAGIVNIHFLLKSKAQNTLKGFYEAHKDKLFQIKLKTQFTLPAFKRQETTTIGDLVEFTLRNPELSCDTLFCLKGELEETTEFPVLVALDDISSFFAPRSGYGDPRELKKLYNPFLAPRFLSLAKLFGESKWNLKNGAYVAATSGASEPIHLFRKSYWGSRSAVQHIEVPALRKQEFDALMSYLDRFTFFKRLVPGGERNFVYYMCGGRPKDIMRYSVVM